MKAAAGRREEAVDVELLSTKSLGGRKIGEIAPLVLTMFQRCSREAKLKHSKVKTSGGIFPLPETLSELSQLGSEFAEFEPSLLLCVCNAMNSYYGVAGSKRTIASKARIAALKALKAYVDGVRS